MVYIKLTTSVIIISSRDISERTFVRSLSHLSYHTCIIYIYIYILYIYIYIYNVNKCIKHVYCIEHMISWNKNIQ